MLVFELTHLLAKVQEVVSYMQNIKHLSPFVLLFPDYTLFIITEEFESNFVKE